MSDGQLRIEVSCRMNEMKEYKPQTSEEDIEIDGEEQLTPYKARMKKEKKEEPKQEVRNHENDSCDR